MTIQTTPSTSTVRLSVAPMMDWTDRHCRAFHRVLAPSALLYTEMVHAQAVIRGDRDRLLGFDPSEHPLALQLGGSEPALLAQAARVAQDWGYDEDNLKCGCPSDRVQAGRFGACLMREPALVAECVSAMRAAAAIPVTVKCRLGVDEQEDYSSLLDFIDTVATSGCRTFIVHARKAWLKGLSPKENREIPPLRHELVHQLQRERPALRILINGGITDEITAMAQFEHVPAIMLGRAAYHDPYFLHRLDARLSSQPPRSREELLDSFLPYVATQCEHGVALKNISRHLLGLYHGQPGGRRFRQFLSENAHRADAGPELIRQAILLSRTELRAA